MSADKVEPRHLVAGGVDAGIVAGGGDPGWSGVERCFTGAGVNAPGYNNRQPMNPAEIEVHIEELVLHGFPPGSRWQIGDTLEHELRGLLAAQGLPPGWLASAERIDAGAIALTTPAATGAEVAQAVYRGGAK